MSLAPHFPILLGSALFGAGYLGPSHLNTCHPAAQGMRADSSLSSTANPLIVSWMSANTAGQTKKAAAFTAFNAASSAGNICGPYLFKATDAPDYYPGLKAVLAIFCVLVGLVALQAVNLAYLNKRKERQRVANGKPAKIADLSMTRKYEAAADEKDGLGQMAFLDQTDAQNDEFVYLL